MRHIIGVLIACALGFACGSGNRGITQPSPQAVLVHNTLNPPDDRATRSIVHSYEHPNPFGFPSANPLAFDDFMSAVTTTIRTVSWQGGYCSGVVTPPPGTSPEPPPTAASTSFQLSFYRDFNGRPAWGGAGLYDITLTPAEAHEQFTFDSGPTANGCGWQSPNATYYDYTAVLPTAFPVTAGTRYWLLVRADTRNAGIAWGWRLGNRDNNYSASNTQFLYTNPWDLAFALSEQ
jgi:hypothetical protein